MADSDLPQLLDRIFSELRNDDAQRRLRALQALEKLNASTPAHLKQAERLAIHDPSEEVRRAAVSLLRAPNHRSVYEMVCTLTPGQRKIILNEIEKWESDGLLNPERADVIKQRYKFDVEPPVVQPAPPVVEPPVIREEKVTEAAVPQPAAPAQPRPSLMQTLLSESSIKIYLYLGAFFVIASALILAALVQAARLPILAAATLAFGGAAFIIHKRLPQPSFALFIVFSFLLPIDANVFEETIGFHEPALSIYWTIIFLLMALIWGFSIWFYASTFFSLVAFAAFSLAFYRAAEVFQTETELQFLFGMFASLVGLAGVYFLKRWKDNKFALPLFLLAQVQVVGVLLTSLAFATVHVFSSDLSHGWWLVVALTWIAAAAFFAASDFLFPFLLFPWAVVAALLPLPWFFLNALSIAQPAYALGFWVWGAVFALTSEAIVGLNVIKRYTWAFLAGSLPLLFTSLVIAFDFDSQPLIFLLFFGTAVVYGVLHLVRPRWYVWSTALFSALLAYFVFFTLPVIQKLEIPLAYQLLVAVLLLTVPELFVRAPLTLQSQSRIPTLALGIMTTFICMAVALTDVTHSGRAAIVFLVFAVLLTLHAFHFDRAWLGYFATSAEIIAILYALVYFDLDTLWVPALTLISALYYGTGFFLRRMDEKRKSWGVVLVNSGLVLGGLLTLAALTLQTEMSGWYIILIALLYAVETFARPLAWLEVIVEILLSLSLYRILADFNPPHALEHVFFGTSLIWLGGDLLFSRLLEKRIHRPLTIGVGYLFVAVAAVSLFGLGNSLLPVTYFLLYAAFFAIYAFSQQDARLGYLTAAFIPLAVIKLYEFKSLEKWMFPLIALAVLYYAIGFILRRNLQTVGWDKTLLNSGLALGVFTSICAPFQGKLDSSIPIAIAATLFAVEAFALKNVWWALPANALYLTSYFVLLSALHVDQPQYYSIGAALLGMIMHLLLTRAESKTGAFLMGMLSQLVLLGTTYIQMVSNNDLRFFFVLFIQSMVVLIYGLLQRSRSLVITPIAFAILGVVTVVYSALKGLSSVILVGCTGIILLLLGIGAVLLRERITRLGEQLSGWKP